MPKSVEALRRREREAMSSSFDVVFNLNDEEVAVSASVGPFDDDDDGYVGYDPRLPSQRFGAVSSSFSPAAAPDDVDAEDPVADDPSGGYGGFHDVPVRHVSGDGGSFPALPEGYGFLADPHPTDFSSVPEPNGMSYWEVDHDEAFASDGPILPPPSEMQLEEGFILREWRRCEHISTPMLYPSKMMHSTPWCHAMG